MPAIDIGGNVYRTLADPIYLEDGRQVKEVWIRPTDTGTPVKVYPESVTPKIYSGTFVYKGRCTKVFDGFIKYREVCNDEGLNHEIARQPYRVTVDASYAFSVDAERASNGGTGQSESTSEGEAPVILYRWTNIPSFDANSTYRTLNYFDVYARYTLEMGDFPDVTMRSSPTDTLEKAFSNKPEYQALLNGIWMHVNVANIPYDSYHSLTTDEREMVPDIYAFRPNMSSTVMTRSYQNHLSLNNSSMTYAKRNPDTRYFYAYYGYPQLPMVSCDYLSASYRNFEKDSSSSNFYITDLNPPAVQADPI